MTSTVAWAAGRMGWPGRLAAALLGCLALAALPVTPAAAQALSAGASDPLIDLIDADEQSDHVNITVQFRCTIRYVGHSPASTGSSVRVQLRLGADCGVADAGRVPENPSVGGSSNLVRSARLDPGASGDVFLELRWPRELSFVLVPTTNSRGLRLRLLTGGGAKARISVGTPDEPPDGYAVNLESRREAFPEADVQAAGNRLSVPVYVSEVTLDGERWYRLRAGPFSSRNQAEKVLLAAKSVYGRAWLGINDETALVPLAGGGLPPSEVATARDPALPAAELDALVQSAVAAFKAREYARAVPLLTKALRQPEFARRAELQEMLGLARERLSQLAQAKAEYQEYLRRYPTGPAATRIRNRLRVLASTGQSATNLGLGPDGQPLGWRNSGSVSQLLQNGREHIDVGGNVSDRTSVSASLTDADWTARHRGESYTFISRISAGVTRDLRSNGTGNATRIAAAYAELGDSGHAWSVRVGRQTRSNGGVLGLFDGAWVNWQRTQQLGFSAAVGMPVDTSHAGLSTERRFVAVAANLGPIRSVWDFSAFLTQQQIDGRADRQAVGLEARYFAPGRTVMTLFDYDIHFHVLNSALVTGSWLLPGRWTLAFDAGHRRAPSISARNALIGQPVPDYAQLQLLFTPDQLRQLALDRTPVSDQLSLSLSRPLGERWQVMADVFALRVGASPASGGVLENPATGWDRTLQVQLTGSSLWTASDLHFFTLREQRSEQARSTSGAWSLRLPITGAWRLGPQLRIERRERLTDQSVQLLVTPEIRLDYAQRKTLFDLYLGSEISKRDLPADTERIRRLYAIAVYRYRF